MRTLSRTDNRDPQRILRQKFAAAVEHCRRIADLPQIARIRVPIPQQKAHPHRLAAGDLLLCLLGAGGRNGRGELRPYPFDLQQLISGGPQRCAGRTKSRDQQVIKARTDSGDPVQPDHIDQFLCGVGRPRMRIRYRVHGVTLPRKGDTSRKYHRNRPRFRRRLAAHSLARAVTPPITSRRTAGTSRGRAWAALRYRARCSGCLPCRSASCRSHRSRPPGSASSA